MAYRNASGQARFGVRSMAVTTGQVDADATSFIAAAGITDLTQASAINVLVNDLKTYGIWSKMKALYPFVGGTAVAHKYNLKDPRDLDAAYRLVFNGGWIHSSNGAKPNGTTGYANTFYNPSTNLTPFLGYYSITNGNTGTDQIDMGSSDLDKWTWVSSWYKAGIYNNILARNSSSSVLLNGGTQTDSRGWYWTNKVSTTAKLGKNGNVLTSAADSTIAGSANIAIGAMGSPSGANYYSNRETAFSIIAEGLSDTDTSNLYVSVQKFQTTLGRQVGAPYVSDSDAQAFLNAASITDTTQASAINTLVTDLKAAGVWTKMKALYPFIGGSATSHKFNLKDPRDLDAAYRLVFNGGWTHTSTGALPNGTTGYADTKLLPSSNIPNQTSVHLSLYSNTDNFPAAGLTRSIGCYSVSPIRDFQIGYYTNSSSVKNNFGTLGGTVTLSNTTSPTTIGFLLSSRTTSTSLKLYKNSTLLQTNTTAVDNTLPTVTTYLGARNGNGIIDVYNNFNHQFASIGDGLTDAESTAFYTAVQKYQTTLGRQVNTPLVSDSDAQAFLSAAGITSYTQANAVNTLVVDLKASGIWAKMKALYPFVGGTSNSHKFNLKDPRDVDAAYRLVFNGGGTHDSNGYQLNGINAYANTFFVPNTSFISQNRSSFGVYSRTDSNLSGRIIMGSHGGSGYIYMYLKDGTGQYALNNTNWSSFGGPVSTYVSKRGFFQSSRNDSSTTQLWQVGNANYSSTSNSTGRSTLSITIGDCNGLLGGYAENVQVSFSYIGDDLSAADLSNYYTAVQKFQTALGRQVGTPVYSTNGLVLNLDAGNANSYPGTGTTWFDLASGNNGTLVNGPTYDSANGGSILFDGVNDNVTFGSNCFGVGLNDTISEFTINVWVNFNSFPNDNNNEIVSWWATGTQTYLDGFLGLSTVSYLGFTNANPTLRFGDGWQNTGVRFNSSTDANKWWNITAIKTANNAYIYLNGILVSTKGSALSWGFNNVLNIGSQFTAGEYLNGKLSSVSLYNRALSATEVLQNFNSSRGRFGL